MNEIFIIFYYQDYTYLLSVFVISDVILLTMIKTRGKESPKLDVAKYIVKFVCWFWLSWGGVTLLSAKITNLLTRAYPQQIDRRAISHAYRTPSNTNRL